MASTMIELEAASVKTPNISQIKVYSVTTSSAVLGDLVADLGSLVDNGKYISMIADSAAVYFFFNTSSAGTVDETQTSGANQCWVLPPLVEKPFVVRQGFQFLVAKGAAATKLRIYVSSFNINE